MIGEKRAIPSTVLLALTVIILFTGCINAPTEKPANVYPGSENYSPPAFIYSVISIPTEGVDIHGYSVPGGNIHDILVWFRDKMLSDGWELKGNISIVNVSSPQTGNISYGGAVFKKGNTGYGIWAWQMETGTYYVVVTGPWSGPWSEFYEYETPGDEADQLPAADQAQGEEPIDRYPGSVLLSYEKSGSLTDFTVYMDYGTLDNVEMVIAWYKQHLESSGWVIEDESSDVAGHYLSLSREREYLDINVYGPSETTAYTEISIYYNKKGLPDEDLVSGYEPVTRYPDSIMLQHTDMNISSSRMISITYGTYDSVEEVKNWYISNMPGEGWTLLGITSVPEGVEMAFTKDSSENLQITVESSGYSITSIEILYTSTV